jgi:hypothetical protein
MLILSSSESEPFRTSVDLKPSSGFLSEVWLHEGLMV